MKMPAAILGRKIGMTRIYNAEGKNVPVTIIEAGPCFVTQVKSADVDGYAAVQLGYDEIKPRNSTQQLIGHDNKAGVAPQRLHREVRVENEELAQYTLGQTITVQSLENVKFVDVTGTSKGKGTAGTMKRHNFKGMSASHGTERKHRTAGSIGGHATNRGFSGRLKKGKRMAGRMGDERVTVRSVEIVGRDIERNLILVKGAVPGANQGFVYVREAKRLYKRKASKLA
jgi:large subunit ribosomal protein L3